MNANDAGVLALLRDLADPDGCVRGVATTAMASKLGISRSTVHLALDRLREVGAVSAQPSTGRTPTTYCLAPQPSEDRPMQPSDNRPTEPSDSTPPSRERSPETSLSPIPLSGNRTSRAGAPEESDGSDGSDGRTVAAGPAVIMAAVAAAKRLGKPPLDEALKTKLGSQAKRMHPAVSIEALEAAAVYLVEHDMTALDAAHRKSQAVAANAVGPLNAMGLRPTPDDLAALWEEAKASEAGRDLASFEPHEEGELVEAWSLIHATWRNTPTILPAERAEWHTGLRPLPIGCILWSIREIAGTGERFAPTWGQVLDVGIPKLLEARRLRRQADAHQRREEA